MWCVARVTYLVRITIHRAVLHDCDPRELLTISAEYNYTFVMQMLLLFYLLSSVTNKQLTKTYNLKTMANLVATARIR